MGAPGSKGCVRMRNADIIDLFDRVPVGTRVEIVAPAEIEATASGKGSEA